MSDRVIGECLVCHLWPKKPIVLSCLHILCSRCLNTTNECPQCREMSTDSVITVEKKVCVGCKENREAVNKCRHCLCVECKTKTRPEDVIGCPVCHWICSDCVTYHEKLPVYDKHVVKENNQVITKEIIDCVKNKREELEREESEWKETIERDMRDVLELQRLEHKMNKWKIIVEKNIIEKIKGIVIQNKISENAINCFNYIETFVNEIMPKMTADDELKQLIFNKLNKCEIVKIVNEFNSSKTVLKDIIKDISISNKQVDDLQDQREESIQMSDIVCEDNETNPDILDNSEKYIPMSSSQSQEKAQDIVEQESNEEVINENHTSHSFRMVDIDLSISEDNEEGIYNQDNSVKRTEAKDSDKDWEYSSAEEDVEEDSDDLTYGEFKCNVCRKCFRTKTGLRRHGLSHKRVETSLPSEVQTVINSSQQTAMALNGDIQAIQISDFVREYNETNPDILDNSEEYTPMSSSQSQEEAQEYNEEVINDNHTSNSVRNDETDPSLDPKDNEEVIDNKDNSVLHLGESDRDRTAAQSNDIECEHSSAEEDVEEDSDDLTYGEFECNVCRKCFRTESGLRSHVLTHKRVEPSLPSAVQTVANSSQQTMNQTNRFLCKQCGKGFDKMYELIVHKRTHTGVRPHTCDYFECGQSFNQMQKLIQHKQRIHRIDRSLKCDHKNCDKTFRTKQHVKEHMKRNHYRYKPHKCLHENCDKSFCTSFELKTHIAYKHCDDRPFKCNQIGCESNFKSRNNLNKHVKTVHKIQ